MSNHPAAPSPNLPPRNEAALGFGSPHITFLPKISVLFERAQVLMAKQSYTEGADCYRQLIADNPDDSKSLIGLGHALCLLEKPEEALPFYGRALKLCPTDQNIPHFLRTAEREVLFINQLNGLFLQMGSYLLGNDPKLLARKLARRLMFVGHYFDKTITQFGASPEGISHVSEEFHTVGLATFRQHIENLNEKCTINDFGCGYGRLFSFVEDLLQPEVNAYVGYDISPKMVATARHQVADSRAGFDVSAIPNRMADYSIANGTFNLAANHDPDEWQIFVHASILAMANTSRRGFSFNIINEVNDPGVLLASRRDLILDFIKNKVGKTAFCSEYCNLEWVVQVPLA